jgi:CBS-domain-containing membrane protein
MRTVRDAMTRNVITVESSTPLKDVAQLLVDRRISGVPVVEDGVVVGIVSEADLLVKESAPLGAPPRRFAWLLGDDAATKARRAKVAALTAGEAMTAPVGPPARPSPWPRPPSA